MASQGSGPPVWGAPTTIIAGDAPDHGYAQADAMKAGAGLGAALGYWLPKGITRAKAATARFKSAIR